MGHPRVFRTGLSESKWFIKSPDRVKHMKHIWQGCQGFPAHQMMDVIRNKLVLINSPWSLSTTLRIFFFFGLCLTWMSSSFCYSYSYLIPSIFHTPREASFLVIYLVTDWLRIPLRIDNLFFSNKPEGTVDPGENSKVLQGQFYLFRRRSKIIEYV